MPPSESNAWKCTSRLYLGSRCGSFPKQQLFLDMGWVEVWWTCFFASNIWSWSLWVTYVYPDPELKRSGWFGKASVCVFCMYVCIFCVYGTTVTTVVVVDHDVVDDDDVVACGDSVEFGKRFFQLQVIMLQSWDVYTCHQHHYCYCYRYIIVVIYSCYVVLLFQSLSLSLSCTSISHCLRAFQVGELLQKMFINAYICFLRTAWPFADCEIQEPIGSWHRKLVLYTRIF